LARILLVDGDVDSRTSVQTAIRLLSGHEVAEASDGLSALERLATESFDLVLLAVPLPGLDGFEVCRRVRAGERTRNAQVVFVTAANHAAESRQRALDAGAADFIVQPVADRELVARIAAVLRTRTAGAPSRPVRPRRRILAIDDDAPLLKAYRRMLTDHHEVTTCPGAGEAMKLFEQDQSFDAVLCDLQMPEMSGPALHGQVASRWPELAERFIFLTGGAFSAEARRFLEQAAVACLNKPFKVDQLLELIESRAGR
jgi:CheY-like chemotaxis protein